VAVEHAQLVRDNKRLTLQLRRAEAVIDIQKKWLRFWVCRSSATRSPDGCRSRSGA
jgi:hypothetical protein